MECKDDTKMTQSCLHTSTTHLNVILQNTSIHVINEKTQLQEVLESKMYYIFYYH